MANIQNILVALDLARENQTYDNFYLARDSKTKELIGVARLEEYPEYYFLSSVGIDPKFQRRGLGKEFLDQLLKNCLKPVFLRTVIPDFFKKAGFQVIAEIKVLAQMLPAKEEAECQWCQPEKCTLMVKLPDATKISGI